MAIPVSPSNKIADTEYLQKEILVAELPIEPAMNGEDLQARFDKLGLLIKNRVNDLVDSLLVSFVASNISNDGLAAIEDSQAATVAGQLNHLMYMVTHTSSGEGTTLTPGVVTDDYLSDLDADIKKRFLAHVGGAGVKHLIGQLPTGTTADKVALGDHTHSGGSITGITPSRALISDTSGQLSTSTVTATELSYLDGASSSIQTQLDGKAASSHFHNASAINAGTLALGRLPTGTTTSTVALGSHTHAGTDIATGSIDQARIPTLAMSKISGLDAALSYKQNRIDGAASSVVSNDLTSWRVLYSDGSGKIAASPAINTTRLDYLADVTGLIQAQINAKQNLITGTASSIATGELDELRVMVTNASKKAAASSVTTAELYQLSGIKTTANIQAQLDNRALLSHTHGFQDLTGVIYQPGTPSTTNNAGKIWLKPIT